MLLRQSDLHGEQIGGAKTRVDTAQTGQALDEQCCADQQHDRQRYLSDDQQAARA